MQIEIAMQTRVCMMFVGGNIGDLLGYFMGGALMILLLSEGGQV